MIDADVAGRVIGLLALLDGTALMAFFWFTLIFEVPRYLLTFPLVAAMAVTERSRPSAPALCEWGRVSVLIAGHNEVETIERCVRSLRRQSLAGIEIVAVSDGSVDGTFAVMQRLHRDGLIDRIAECQIRGGKPSALNLAARLASGSILVVIDCDCSCPEDALAELVAPFADPRVGAVAGRVLVRNPDRSLVTTLQAIEYLTGMTLGRAQLALFGQLAMVSGALGAFRRDAWNRVGGMDPGPGEDFDCCLRLRLAGYRIAFAHRAVAYTDVPERFSVLLRQRKRWERDALWLRLRKHGRAFNPFAATFHPRESLHQIDFLLFTLLPTIVMPVFVTALVVEHGAFAGVILLAAAAGLLVLDAVVLALAIIAHGERGPWRLLLFLPLHGLFQAYVLRLARLKVFIEEWIFSPSRQDGYSPPKVNAWMNWR